MVSRGVWKGEGIILPLDLIIVRLSTHNITNFILKITMMLRYWTNLPFSNPKKNRTKMEESPLAI